MTALCVYRCAQGCFRRKTSHLDREIEQGLQSGNLVSQTLRVSRVSMISRGRNHSYLRISDQAITLSRPSTRPWHCRGGQAATPLAEETFRQTFDQRSWARNLGSACRYFGIGNPPESNRSPLENVSEVVLTRARLYESTRCPHRRRTKSQPASSCRRTRTHRNLGLREAIPTTPPPVYMQRSMGNEPELLELADREPLPAYEVYNNALSPIPEHSDNSEISFPRAQSL